jgi:hypothetical protein
MGMSATEPFVVVSLRTVWGHLQCTDMKCNCNSYKLRKPVPLDRKASTHWPFCWSNTNAQF